MQLIFTIRGKTVTLDVDENASIAFVLDYIYSQLFQKLEGIPSYINVSFNSKIISVNELVQKCDEKIKELFSESLKRGNSLSLTIGVFHTPKWKEIRPNIYQVWTQDHESFTIFSYNRYQNLKISYLIEIIRAKKKLHNATKITFGKTFGDMDMDKLPLFNLVNNNGLFTYYIHQAPYYIKIN